MLQKILSELKVVIDHTENNWSTDKLFWCYEQLEKYADGSFPLDKPVKPEIANLLDSMIRSRETLFFENADTEESRNLQLIANIEINLLKLIKERI